MDGQEGETHSWRLPVAAPLCVRCLCVAEGEGGVKEGREGVDVVVLEGWVNRRGWDQEVNSHIWPQEQLSAKHHKIRLVAISPHAGRYTCQNNPTLYRFYCII